MPIGERALAWVETYLEEARPELVLRAATSRRSSSHAPGERFTPDGLGTDGAPATSTSPASGSDGSCHLFRHTVATLMLEGGADIRYIQEMLGHAKLDTTQIYTQVSIRKLKEIHAATHPGAKLGKSKEVEDS